MARKNLSTIRNVNSSRIEKLDKDRKRLAEFNLYRYPCPTKKESVNSLGKLRSKIKKFFEQYEVDGGTSASSLPLPNDLALFLGFSSYRAMAQAINSPTDPEWSAELERAVEHINSMLMRSELDIATKSKDSKGIDNVIRRLDRINESSMPREADPKSQVNIQINIEHRKKIDDFVMDRVSSLMGDMREADPIEDAEFEEADE